MAQFKDIKNEAVRAVFESYPEGFSEKLLFLRELILNTAEGIAGVGELEETLKWGEPSYLTSKSKSGSTIRIDLHGKEKRQYAMYFNCKTSLVDTFREIYAEELRFEGNRAIVFQLGEELLVQALEDCITMALTYHLKK